MYKQISPSRRQVSMRASVLSRLLALARSLLGSAIDNSAIKQAMDTHPASTAEFRPAQLRAKRASRHTCHSTAIIAGSLLGDLNRMARDLWRVLHVHPITVWMNADAEILYQFAGRAPEIIPAWIAGTYDINATPTDIESDLYSLKAERRAIGMLDD
jgi:hypothetical protein